MAQSRTDSEAQREKLIREYQEDHEEKATAWSNAMNRLTTERDDKEKSLEDLRNELERSCKAHKGVEQQLRHAKSELEGVRKEILGAAAKSNSDRAAAVTEIAGLKQSLRSERETSKAREHENNMLRQENLSMVESLKTLDDHQCRLQDQLHDEQSTSSAIRARQEESERKREEALSAMRDSLHQLRSQIGRAHV